MARILFVEDNESLARVITHALRAAGHTTLPAPTGHAALLAARAHPDLIFLDLGLPDMSGDEVLRRLKREPETAWIPVVVVSGEADAVDRVPRNPRTGAVAILQKPVLGSELCAVVEFVLEGQATETGDARRASLGHAQREIVYRLISTGSGPLVRQLLQRVVADQRSWDEPTAAPAPSWKDLACAGRREGLLSHGEEALLAGRPAVVAASH